MEIVYTLGIHLYYIFIHLAALFNSKARLWVDGRKHIFGRLATEIRREQKLVWVHCASLGEFEQARPVIEAMKSEYPTTQILLTFFSPSGYEIRKNYELADYIYYLPADIPAQVNRFLDLVQPDLVLFIKYEFWYHYLKSIQQRKIPCYLVSAIFHQQQPFFNPIYGRFFRTILPCFDRIFVQNEASAHLLQRIGIQHFEITGDTRIDRVLTIAKQAKKLSKVAAFKSNRPVLVGGSTWTPDEAILIPHINNHPDEWKYIIAPHDISESHLQQIEQHLQVPHQRYSQFRANGSTKVLIIDNIGLLSTIYQYGTIAYIGGGFGAGIHNTLEPIAFGLPVLFGPKYKKFEEAVQLLGRGGAFVVNQPTDFKQNFDALQVTTTYQQASQAAKAYIVENEGASKRIMDYFKLVDI